MEAVCPIGKVADLPAPPPYRFSRAFRTVLGPGIIALGGSIGSGEWLLGLGNHRAVRRTTPLDRDSRYPAPILHQYRGNSLHNLHRRADVQRLYALQSRGRGSGHFFYSGIDFFGIWPGWAATAATAIAAAWLGYMPGEADQGTVRLFAYLAFFLCLGIVLFGKEDIQCP